MSALVGIAKNGVVLLSNTYNHMIEQSFELATTRKEFTLDKNSFLKSFSIRDCLLCDLQKKIFYPVRKETGIRGGYTLFASREKVEK